MMQPNVLILHASGTNRDHEAARAIELAGGTPHIKHINQLRQESHPLKDFHMLILAGGFSYGDALGAGQRLALDLNVDLVDALQDFVATGKPVLGICNGFQALVKAGILPAGQATATLSHNRSQRFECRWVWLEANSASPCVFTKDLNAPIYCPAAHAEGQFISAEAMPSSQIALRYSNRSHELASHELAPHRLAQGHYPDNPNGSAGDIAGICNAAGNVLGLMPHPEDNVLWYQQPQWTRTSTQTTERDARALSGLAIFKAGIRYALKS